MSASLKAGTSSIVRAVIKSLSLKRGLFIYSSQVFFTSMAIDGQQVRIRSWSEFADMRIYGS